MILARLRRETAALHQDVEREVDLLSPTLSTQRYIRILQAFHVFFIPWESALDAYCPASFVETWRGQKRAHQLEHDLRTLHSTEETVPSVTVKPPDLSDLGHWLGALYVIEGSTLGGQIISRHLETHFGWHDGSGYSFFRGHGDNTATQWRLVCAALEGAAALDNQIIAGAHLTFVQLRRCLRLLL
jgi:heme oxygenase